MKRYLNNFGTSEGDDRSPRDLPTARGSPVHYNSLNLRIAETFASIQGEGIWVGIPSAFIRLSGCNLRCVWCDTPYASWTPEGEFVSVDQVVKSAMDYGLHHVVITGGEPMLFDAVEPLARELANMGCKITIETAGTMFRDLPCDLMSISPKLSNSTPPVESGWSERHDTTRAELAPLIKLIEQYRVQLKFVVNPESGDDLSEIDELLAKLPTVQPNHILLMPEGTDSETLRRRGKLLVPVCLERNWRLTPRFHVDLFGNKRGA